MFTFRNWIACGMLLVIGWFPSGAAAFRCARRPPVMVAFPRPNVSVTRNSVVFLVLQRSSTSVRPQLYWFSKRAYVVPTRVERTPGSTLMILRPLKSLRAAGLYEVRLGSKILRRFRTNAKWSPKIVPRLHQPTLCYSKPVLRIAPAGIKCGGRQVTLKMAHRLGNRPELVQAKVTFTYRKGNTHKVQWTQIYTPKMIAASSCTPGCSFIRKPVGPVRGRYDIQLTPWSTLGHKGPSVRIRGVIR